MSAGKTFCVCNFRSEASSSAYRWLFSACIIQGIANHARRASFSSRCASWFNFRSPAPESRGEKKVLKCLCNAYVISLLANGKRFSSQLLRVDKQVQQAMMRKYLSKTLRGFSSSARRFNQRKRVRRRRKPENYCTPRWYIGSGEKVLLVAFTSGPGKKTNKEIKFEKLLLIITGTCRLGKGFRKRERAAHSTEKLARRRPERSVINKWEISTLGHNIINEGQKNIINPDLALLLRLIAFSFHINHWR